MSTNQTDVVGDYLREVELRLSGLPLLQRRELLADLQTHIDTARVERNIRSEGEMIEVLERLGSPDVVAAAAYEEGGPVQTPEPDAKPAWLRWILAGAAVLVLLLLISIVSLHFLGRDRVLPAGSVPPGVRPTALQFDPAPADHAVTTNVRAVG
jgi:uncharacterized membrane protein